MSIVKASITMSVDGFVAGPRQSEANPMGEGGMRLHQWAFPLDHFAKMMGKPSGEVNESNAAIIEQQGNVGATIMGRNMFGPTRGPWTTPAWNGWWGDDPPYHHPVFVLTHQPRERLTLEGNNTFTFVTGGPAEALAKAKEAAGDKDVHVAGGCACVQQYLRMGAIQQITINLAPVLLGAGERLFDDSVGASLAAFEHAKTTHGPVATHLTFRRR